MGHSPRDGNSVIPANHRIAGSVKSSDHAGLARRISAQALCAAQSEVEQLTVTSYFSDASGFGSDQSLKVEHIEQDGLHDLGFYDGSFHGEYWPGGKYQITFPAGIHLAPESESPEVLQKFGIKALDRKSVV